jgi:molecular chaperone GrpE
MADAEEVQPKAGEESAAPETQPVEETESAELAELRKKAAELEDTVAQLKDQLLRLAAEFDNYKKRTEAETISVIRFANEDLLVKLLPVVDDLDRSFKALGKAGDDADSPDAAIPVAPPREAAFVGGIELIHAKLKKILEQVGLKPFDSVGKPFDPELHDALLQVTREDLPHHTVIEEIEKGYELNDKVVRHARVIVSARPGGGEK